MLGDWLAAGRPHYVEMGPNQRIPYISDIGAQHLQPLFIAGSTVMVVVFDFAFISERWLRHKGRLTPNYSRREASLSIGAIFFAIVGAAGLILLTIFDNKNHGNLHDAFLGVFMGGYVISAIFICAEYQRLGKHFRQHRILRASFWLKLAFIFLEVILGVSFGATQYTGHYNVSGVLEWIVALIYIFYVWSFIVDFLPALKTKAPEDRFPRVRRGDDEHALKTQEEGNMQGGPVYTNGGYQPEMTGPQYGQPAQPSRNF